MNDLAPALFGVPRPLRDADLLPDDQPFKPFPPIRRWRNNAGVRALVFMATLVAASLLFMIVLVMGLSLTGTTSPEDMQATLTPLSSAVLIPPAALAYWVLTRWFEGRRPVYEASWRRAGRGVLTGLALGAGLMLACTAILGLLGVYRIEGFNPAHNPWPFIIAGGFGAGIFEEILFRGVLFRLVEDTFGTWASAAVSGLVFGFVHMTNDHATVQGALGIALTAGLLLPALYVFTRSLWVVMGVHFAWNVVQGSVLGIVVSGGTAAGDGFIRSSLTGPELLSGGTFGIEASVVTIVLLTLIAAWLFTQVHRRGLVVQPSWVRRRRLSAAEPVNPAELVAG